jgi:SAM-dependent methyltransferase
MLSKSVKPSAPSVTLERMDGAVHYNAWLGQRFRAHLGRRVLEVGAGIGTITAQLAAGLELLIALEADPERVARLEQRFIGMPWVRPLLTSVEATDWSSLAAERLDTVVFSNVLEHIEDDVEALSRVRGVLVPGGRLLLLVPALPALFGTMDEAVGHYRRYTPGLLRDVVARSGFALESLEWMNLLGIPGWYVNGKLLRRRAIPPFQLRLYDRLAPALARLESRVRLPVGLSLFAVARASGGIA